MKNGTNIEYLLHKICKGKAIYPILNKRSSLPLGNKLTESQPVFHALLPRRFLFQRTLKKEEREIPQILHVYIYSRHNSNAIISLLN